MSNTIGMIFGFLGGTIVAVEGGYKILQHPSKERIYQRLSDAKWFLALRWCEQFSTAAAILTNTGQLSFYNQTVLEMGEEAFIPRKHRLAIFRQCLPLQPGETVIYSISYTDFPHNESSFCRSVEITGVEIDPRYGKVALVREPSPKLDCVTNSSEEGT